jgi:predicted small metal-binding protein
MAWGRHRQLLAQKTAVYCLRRRAWGGPQLVTQAPSERLVHEQSLRSVASGFERLHQQAVSALAVRRALDQLPGGSCSRVELPAADRDAGAPDELQRADEDLLEPPALRVDPGRVLAWQEPARRHVLRDASGPPGTGEVPLSDRALRSVKTLGRRLEIDPRVVGKREPEIAPAVDRDDLPHFREERTQPVGVARLAPERFAELVAHNRAPSVRGEVHEREPALTAGKRLLDPPAVDPHDEPAAELDPRLCQGFAKVTATRLGDNAQMIREEEAMGKVIHCECGEVVRADNDDELVQKVERHVGAAHPELVGKLSREDVLGMAEEA